MKVLLLNPAPRRGIRSILPPGVESSRGLFPPLGILYLAASLQEAEGVEVEVLDAQAEKTGPDQVALKVAEGGHDLVGITTLTFNLLDAMDNAMAVKAARPRTTVMAGGPHPHLFPGETLALGPFDGVLRGEGERSLSALCRDPVAAFRNPPPGVWWKGGQKGEPDPAPFIEDLDALPFPARGLTRIERYHSVLSDRRPVTTMMSSRGCPYQCAFCDRPHLGKKFRARKAENVLAEMKECAEMGIREIVFYDDTFSVDRERVRRLCELILGEGRVPAWDIRARVSDFGEGDFELLARAGLGRVHFGVESGDPDILRSIKKGITVDQARKSFAGARKAGIETLAYFMVGLPGESEDSLERTLELAIELDPDFAHFSMFIPFPGTPLYKEGLESGIIASDAWSEFARSPSPDFTPPVWEDRLDRGRLLSALGRMYKAFYRRPRVIARRLFKLRSLGGLVSGARMGARVLFMRER